MSKELELLEEIINDMNGIVDGVSACMDDEDETVLAIEKTEHKLLNLRAMLAAKEPKQVRGVNFYSYFIDEMFGESHHMVSDFGENGDNMMLAICRHFHFKEEPNKMIDEIIYNGRRIKYFGKQPYNVYEFRDVETGEMAWWGKFPGWPCN